MPRRIRERTEFQEVARESETLWMGLGASRTWRVEREGGAARGAPCRKVWADGGSVTWRGGALVEVGAYLGRCKEGSEHRGTGDLF